MGTRCNLRWREADDRELIWTVAPQHPIAAGVPHPIVLATHEMYGEYFDIPPPDELVFISSFRAVKYFAAVAVSGAAKDACFISVRATRRIRSITTP